MAERKIMKKVCLLGDAAVGKTSLIRRYVYDMFDDKYIVTFGAKVTTKRLSLNFSREDVDITLIIWDILGQRVHDSLHAGHYRGAKGAFIVCDLTRKETLHNMEIWMEKFIDVVGKVPIILLGNKADLPHGTTQDELKRIANKSNIQYFPTSAKTGQNVEDAFRTLATIMVEGS